MGDVKDLVDRVWTMYESKDFARAPELLTPDAEITYPDSGDKRLTLRGPGPWVERLRGTAEAFPDIRHEVVSYLESGNRIAVELRITGTHKGPLQFPDGDVAPTGRRVVWQSVDLIEEDEGKIKTWHIYFDQLAFYQQLGLTPPKG